MNKRMLFLLLATILVLAACGGADAQPTAAPATEAPAEAAPTELPPTAEPPVVEQPTVEAPAPESAAGVDAIEHVPDPNLIDKTWAWERRELDGAIVENVPNPENYTLFFNADGIYNAKVDCNNSSGRYATPAASGGQNDIIMEAGAMTMAFCGEESLDTTMTQLFDQALTYEFAEAGAVVLFTAVDGGPVDYFRSVSTIDLPEPAEGAAIGTVTAPDGVFLRTGPGTNYPYVGAAPFEETGEIIGVSQDGLWWLADAPNQPGGEVWVSAEWVEVTGAENVPVVAAPTVELILTGTPWEWVSTTDPAQGTVAVNDPSRYVILFSEDGSAAIQADCNAVYAAYTTNDSNISINTGPSTMAACPPDTLDSQFLAQLSAAAIYFIEGGNLYLDLPADSGTMRFVPQGTPPPVENPPAGEAEGKTFYLVSFGPEGEEEAVIAGTTITANFANDLVSGNAGCNNYSGQLTPVDDHFTVGPILTTLQFCDSPAGVMEQETAYLTALGTTGGYEWQETLTNGILVTEGKLFYELPGGAIGVLNLTTSP